MGGLTMAKAVLISIRPEWVEKIARGEKTVEVRKTRPKLETPFKCYVYRTKGTVPHIINGKWEQMEVGGTVIAEFTCDRVETIKAATEPYGIYDKPRELREFKKINRDCFYANLGIAKRDCPDCKNSGCFLERPPQSWRYVEDLA